MLADQIQQSDLPTAAAKMPWLEGSDVLADQIWRGFVAIAEVRSAHTQAHRPGIGTDAQYVLAAGRQWFGIGGRRLIVLPRRQDAGQEGHAADGALQPGDDHDRTSFAQRKLLSRVPSVAMDPDTR